MAKSLQSLDEILDLGKPDRYDRARTWIADNAMRLLFAGLMLPIVLGFITGGLLGDAGIGGGIGLLILVVIMIVDAWAIFTDKPK